jgi:hypothetical protein
MAQENGRTLSYTEPMSCLGSAGLKGLVVPVAPPNTLGRSEAWQCHAHVGVARDRTDLIARQRQQFHQVHRPHFAERSAHRAVLPEGFRNASISQCDACRH